MRFADLNFSTPITEPVTANFTRAEVSFDNGYGASVIRDDFLRHARGTYELAVLNRDGMVDHENPVADEPIGGLSEADVTRMLGEIQALPPKVTP